MTALFNQLSATDPTSTVLVDDDRAYTCREYNDCSPQLDTCQPPLEPIDH